MYGMYGMHGGGMLQEDFGPTEDDIGFFLTNDELLDWYEQMQTKFPSVYGPDESLYGANTNNTQHPMGAQLMTYFDDDVNKPMYCEVMGSRWKTDEWGMGIVGNKQPMYVVRINGEISQIYLTSAHEEGGWFVRGQEKNQTMNADSSSSDDDDDDDENHKNMLCTPISCHPSNYNESQVTNYVNAMSRQSIQCDGPNCTTIAPSKRCSKCHTAYYCSKECQKLHWKQGHKSDCNDANYIRTMVNMEGGRNDRNDCDIYDKKINFNHSSHIKFPFGLGMKSEKEICIDHARIYISKAASEPSNSEGRYEYCDKALDVLNNLQEEHDNNDVEILCTKAQILSLDNRTTGVASKYFEQAIEINEQHTQKARNINSMLDQVRIAAELGDERRAEHLMNQIESMNEANGDDDDDDDNDPPTRVDDPFELPLLLAQSYILDKNWTRAMDTYMTLLQQMDSPNAGTPPQQRQVYMGVSQCLYELGKYDRSIAAGEMALEMNRHYPQVHKYIALAYKAKGDVDTALKIMEQGVLYETPWDYKNVKVVIEQYEEMKHGLKTTDTNNDDNSESRSSKVIKQEEVVVVPIWNCEICHKTFKSEGKYDDHLLSKNHRKKMKQLKKNKK